MTDSTCPSSICRYRNRVTGHCEYSGPCVMAVYSPPEKENRKMADGLTKVGYDDLISQFDILKIVGQLRDQYLSKKPSDSGDGYEPPEGADAI